LTTTVVKVGPDGSHWRLQSFLDDGLQETVKVYNYCYKGKQSSFVPARDFEKGSHSVVAHVIKQFHSVDSKPLDAFATLDGRFESGKTYVFQNAIEDNKAKVWIANAETGEAVTSKEMVKLTVPDVVDNKQYQNRRCSASTL